MRAISLTSFGGLDALELIDMPEPSPGEGEEVVKVRAVALGRWDLLAPEGWFVELGGSSEFPQVQGWTSPAKPPAVVECSGSWRSRG